MKIGTIITATDINPLYCDFIPMFIKAWNKILPNADVKIILVAESIPENLIEYKNNIILYKPIDGIPNAYITQCIRILYPREITRDEGVLITDMDMIPLNKSFYVDPIKDIENDNFIVIAAEGRDIPQNGNIQNKNIGQIWLCYNVATPIVWKQVFGNEKTDILLKKWYNEGTTGWFSDQEILTKYVNEYKGKKKVILNSELKFNRLDRSNNEVYKNLDKLNEDIKKGVYSDYHALRPYNQYKDINDLILNSISQYGGKRNIKRKTRKLKRKYKTRKLKKTQQKGGNSDELICKYGIMYGIKKTFENNKIENIYYVKVDDLNNFKIPEDKFVLVTGASDYTLPDDYQDKFNEIIKSPNLVHWYAQNLSIKGDKITIYPIGIDYHTDKSKSSNEQEKELILIQQKAKSFDKRELKVYVNFLHSIRGRYGEKDRKEALQQIPNELLVKEENKVSVNDTWNKMSTYAFTASPLGNGYDCHRTWEVLALGGIPIVKTSPIDPLYEDLPVLIVKEWSDINDNLLKYTIQKFKNKKFNMNKIKLDYWIDKIKKSKEQSGGKRRTKKIKKAVIENLRLKK